MKVSPDSQYIYATNHEGNLFLFELDLTADRLIVHEAHNKCSNLGSSTQVTVSSDNQHVYVANDDSILAFTAGPRFSLPNTMGKINLLQPENNAEFQSPILLFDWSTEFVNERGRLSYTLSISDIPDMSNILYKQTNLCTSMGSAPSNAGLVPSETYYWQVTSFSISGTSTLSEIYSFTTTTDQDFTVLTVSVNAELPGTPLSNLTINVTDEFGDPAVRERQIEGPAFTSPLLPLRYVSSLTVGPSTNLKVVVSAPGFETVEVPYTRTNGMPEYDLPPITLRSTPNTPDIPAELPATGPPFIDPIVNPTPVDLTPNPTAGFTNISTNATISGGTTGAIAEAGFVLSGGGTAQLMLRGFVPTADVGNGVNPRLILVQLSNGNVTIVDQNNDWQNHSSAPTIRTLSTNLQLPNVNGNDAGMLLTLSAGTYVLQMFNDGPPGRGVVGVDLISTDGPKLINISTNATISGGTIGAIAGAGFVLSGSGPTPVMLRGFVPPTDVGSRVDPSLRLVQSGVILSQNDGWQNHSSASTIGSLTSNLQLPNANGSDAGMLMRLEPGVYSLQMFNGGFAGRGVVGVDLVP